MAETLLGLHILNDLALLVPIALAVIFLVLFAAGRSIWAAILPLVEVGAGLVFTFGIMGWVGTPIYLTTTIVPVILIAIGVADEIHIFHRYRQVSGETAGGDATPSIVRTLLEMRRPVISTSLTSSLGFLSFVASPIGPVKMFGVYTALGILFCLAWSLFAIPAALRLLGPERVELRSSVSPRTDPWAPRVALAVRRHRSPILIAFALLALAAPFGIRRIVVQDSWIDAFARSSEFRTSTERVNGLFDGTHLLRVRWRTRPGGLLDLEEVRRLKRFEEFLDARTDVGGVLGPHEFMSTVHFVAAGRREEARQLDAEDRTPERALRLAAHYHGLSRRNQIVEPTNSAALVTLFLKDANFVETRGLMAAIRDYERRELGPFGIQLAFAGDVAVSQAMIAAVTETQVSSLLFCLAGVLLVSLALTRSWRDGTLTVVPAAIAAGLMFALLGWARIPLGVATSMFGAISVGIGVDYAIHFLDRIRHAEQAGLDRERSVVEAARIAGPAILMDAGAIAGGFAVLFFSRIPANHRLGGLVVLCVVTCVIATLVVIPALRAGPRAPVRKAPGP